MMPTPTQTEMFMHTLRAMTDGDEHTRRELPETVRESLGLTDADASELTGSGIPAYQSRVGWAISYLNRARYIDRVGAGTYRINGTGIDALERNPDPRGFAGEMNSTIARIDPWRKSADNPSDAQPDQVSETMTDDAADDARQSPDEELSRILSEFEGSLSDELLGFVGDCSPKFFEKLVVDLLEKMGYGEGSVTRYTRDGGIDGIVSTDELGFNPIYTQAKHYADGNKVGRAEVQAFIGALNGARNGIFITTSEFTQDAIDCARGCKTSTISLVDGRMLASLMIKYDLGVATERTIKIRRVDRDYFDM